VSLGILFFVSRNQKIETGFHRSLAYVFIIHSILFAGILVRNQSIFGKLENDVRRIWGDVVMLGGAVFSFWCALIGILALLRRDVHPVS
jgi:hypothetical protein